MRPVVPCVEFDQAVPELAVLGMTERFEVTFFRLGFFDFGFERINGCRLFLLVDTENLACL
jgi:hypothetical protein